MTKLHHDSAFLAYLRAREDLTRCFANVLGEILVDSRVSQPPVYSKLITVVEQRVESVADQIQYRSSDPEADFVNLLLASTGKNAHEMLNCLEAELARPDIKSKKWKIDIELVKEAIRILKNM